MNMAKKKGGWFRESERHALASKGIKTGTKDGMRRPRVPAIARSVKPTDDTPEFLEASNKTTVIFRKYPDGEIIALFPLMPDSAVSLEPLIMSYLHIGQHGGANYQVVLSQTTPATPAEYGDLAKELEEVGYENLVIRKRISYDELNKAREDLRRYYEAQGMR